MSLSPLVPSSVLIVRLSALGDVAHTLALLDALRMAMPGTRFGWLVEELSAPLLEHHPALEKVYVVPRKRWRGNWRKVWRREVVPFFREIRRDGWEAAIDAQGLTKSAAAAWWTGARRRVGFARPRGRELSTLFYNRTVGIKAVDLHAVEEGLRLVEAFGLEVPERLPLGTIHLLEEEKEGARRRLRDAGWSGEGLLLVNPGSAWPSKRWPPRHFVEAGRLLHERTGLRPLILWGPGEEALRDGIAAGLRPLDPIISPRTANVRELALFLSLGRLLLGNDTGPAHIASILGVPVIGVYGASLGVRNAPWTAGFNERQAVVVQRRELDCIECLRRECPLTGERWFACLEGLEPARVIAEAKPLLDHHFPRPR